MMLCSILEIDPRDRHSRGTREEIAPRRSWRRSLPSRFRTNKTKQGRKSELLRTMRATVRISGRAGSGTRPVSKARAQS